MGPANNLAERRPGPLVMARKIRHSPKTGDGMGEFGILVTCVMAWRARGRDACQTFRDPLSGTGCRRGGMGGGEEAVTSYRA